MNESEQDRQDREAAEHHEAMTQMHRFAHDALVQAAKRPLSADEIAAISWWGSLGVTEKEIHV